MMNYLQEGKYPDYFFGMSQFRDGNYYEAIKSFSSAVNTHPYCITAYFHRARSYVNLKQYENALSDFNRALTIALNNQDRTDLRENYYIENYNIYMDRGLAYSSLGEYQKALQDYQTARQEIIASGDPSGQELLPQLDLVTMSAKAYILNNKQPPVSSEPSTKVNNINTVAKGYIEEQKTSYDWDNKDLEVNKKTGIDYVKQIMLVSVISWFMGFIGFLLLSGFILLVEGELSWGNFGSMILLSSFPGLFLSIYGGVEEFKTVLKEIKEQSS